jgi:trimethylamine:corrinoid methyltransferase-like protein
MLSFYQDINFKGDFLKQKITRELFRVEQNLPSEVIDRSSYRGWKESGSNDTFQRAKQRVEELLNTYSHPKIDNGKLEDLDVFMRSLSQKAGMEIMPEHD